ncbi:HEPN domain-containing protein [uncultured Gelidibacter sp.]|uniref:HEPN domain-containing protein n=1 Tax=uncultured Gelidibacter sp. TaxID=259318 RepID=UPI00262EBDAA|nr:HEPN domain-containing protein [uncultured Gelidibacter sp.]
MNNTDLKIEFWKELWTDLISNFLKRSYGFNLYSPQILIEDIITEIEDNKFKNADNKRYFSAKVAEYKNNDEVIKTILKSEFSLLQKAINTTKDGYTLSLCKQIKTILEKGLYFKHTLELVENIILSDDEINLNFVNKINYYSQSLIVDFIKKTYVLEDIENFLTNIFDNYSYYRNSTLLNTKFPVEINHNDYKNEFGELDKEKYTQVKKEKIDNLSLRDRINALGYYYNKETEKVKYIFVIRGLKSENIINKNVLGVTFYTPDIDTPNDLDYWENLQRDSEPSEKYLQAKVEVDYLMPKSSSKIAKRKLETAIDVLHCYFNIKSPLSYNEYGYIIYDENGKMIFSKGGDKYPDENIMHFNSLDISQNEKQIDNIQEFSFIWNDSNNNETLSKIKNALRWHRKAEQSHRDEDRILNYWIALETLCNMESNLIENILDKPRIGKAHIVQEIVASREVYNFVYDYGWELYWYYRNKNYYKSKLPHELIKKAQIKVEAGDEIYLKNFIDCLDEIKKHETNVFILDKINAASKFYEDLDYTKSIINQHISNIKTDILMIARIRNLIVHNAHYDNTLLPYYAWKAKSYCGGLLRKFINEFDEEKTLSTIIFDIYINKEKFLMDFDDGKVNLFDKK